MMYDTCPSHGVLLSSIHGGSWLPVLCSAISSLCLSPLLLQFSLASSCLLLPLMMELVLVPWPRRLLCPLCTIML